MKMRILYLGDIHGNFRLINEYVKLYGITNAHIIQVGDYGVGFAPLAKEAPWPVAALSAAEHDESGNFFG